MKPKYNEIINDLPKPYWDINFYMRSAGWSMQPHCHDYFQFIIIVEGTLDISCNNSCFQLSNNQMAVIPPGLYHKLYTAEGYKQYGINLTEEMDERGIVELLQNSIKDFSILKLYDLSFMDQLLNLAKPLSLASRLKAASSLDSFIADCTDQLSNRDFDNFREKLLKILHDHLSSSPRLAYIAKEMCLSQTQLERLCKREFGCGIIKLLNNLKIAEASTLLLDEGLSIGEICSRLDFYDQAYFCKSFKKARGMSPLEYRRFKLRQL